MTGAAIHLEHVGKQYRVGVARARHRTLREALAVAARAATRRLVSGPSSLGGTDAFWALQDVSFEIHPGEAVGIIGGNGAGKSTLLKILSRITEPSTGEATLRGRVGSLLEVGTGFHPELTGRENVYLNGAILGMRRQEIARRFDEIVAFAEVERFIDTPVKHFSSGMYLRLAFAVAAHLEPDILVMDEVLAVGDAAFQKKCLGKMNDVVGVGRTVLFVSHDLDAVRRLCPRTIMLERGRVMADGATGDVISRYLSRDGARAAPEAWVDLSAVQRTGTGHARFGAVRYTSGNDATGGLPFPDGPLEFTLAIDSGEDRRVESLAVTIRTQGGDMLVNADVLWRGEAVSLRQGRTLLRLHLDELHLNPGVYVVSLWLSRAVGETFDYIESALEIEVVGTGVHPPVGFATRDGLVSCRFDVAHVADEAGPGASAG